MPQCLWGSRVRAPAVLELSCGEDHTCLGPTCACLTPHRMRCLTMPVLLRALAQAQASTCR